MGVGADESSLEAPGGEQSSGQDGHGEGQLDARVAGQGDLGVVGAEEVAATAVAEEAVAVLDALLVALGGGQASPLEGAIHGPVAVPDVAAIAELVDGADGGHAVRLHGAGRGGWVARALEALRPSLGEDIPVAALRIGAEHALQLVVAGGASGVVQIGGTTTNRVTI